MIYILGALALVFVSNSAALWVTVGLPIKNFLDISLLCGVLHQGANECLDGALNVAYVMLGGTILSTCIIWLWSRCNSVKLEFQLNSDNEKLLFSMLFIVFVLQSVQLYFSSIEVEHISRIKEISESSTVISLANLLWPLLLQLSNSSKKFLYRFSYFLLLLLVALFSPFRGVLLAIVIFGIIIPGMSAIYNNRRNSISTANSLKLFLGMLVVGALVFSVYSETVQRATNIDRRASSGSSALSDKVVQRLSYPLFQAYLAEQLSALRIELPGVSDSVLNKFRLTDRPNLNQYLYSEIYGTGSVGETTSLYYGEAAANSNTFPLVWITLGPVFLYLIFRVSRKLGVESSTLVGIAIWRGSLGGVVEVLPALLIQIVLLFLLIKMSEFLSKRLLLRNI